MKNLFASSSNRPSAVVLKPGTYTIELVGISSEAPRWVNSPTPRERIKFCFKTSDSGESVNRSVSATNNARGRLLEFVRQMAGDNQPTQEQIGDGQKFTAYLESLVGKKFRAVLGPSDDGRFTNILSIGPSMEREES